jgi:hypothetical protein
MRSLIAILGLASFLFTFTGSAMAAEQVENPTYASWSKYKPGTEVTSNQTMVMTGMTMKMEMHQKLTKVTDDNVTVDTWSIMDMGGTKRETPKHSMTIPAKVDKGSENMPAGYTGKAEVLGNEDVTVGDKKYTCQVIHFTGEHEGSNVDGKMWSSTEVPGTMVKMDMNMTGEQAGEMKTELVKVTLAE